MCRIKIDEDRRNQDGPERILEPYITMFHVPQTGLRVQSNVQLSQVWVASFSLFDIVPKL